MYITRNVVGGNYPPELGSETDDEVDAARGAGGHRSSAISWTTVSGSLSGWRSNSRYKTEDVPRAKMPLCGVRAEPACAIVPAFLIRLASTLSPGAAVSLASFIMSSSSR
jgi:hypothetical protein